MANSFKIVAGDTITAGEISWVLKSAGVVQNLTGATVRWKRRLRTAPIGTAQETKVMSLVGAATLGVVTVGYTSAETALLLGEHVVNIEVTFADLSVKTFPDADTGPITMIVVEGL